MRYANDLLAAMLRASARDFQDINLAGRLEAQTVPTEGMHHDLIIGLELPPFVQTIGDEVHIAEAVSPHAALLKAPENRCAIRRLWHTMSGGQRMTQRTNC